MINADASAAIAVKAYCALPEALPFNARHQGRCHYASSVEPR